MQMRIDRVEKWGQIYEVEVDGGRVTAAKVHVKAHDKAGTWRRVKHPVTLARLTAAILGSAQACPHCGRMGAAPSGPSI